ncbi:hypothetical protein [Anaeromyxobacter oryzae]|uniref:Protochlamydia outer membrane protein domain-containing protein n=1 Tax=Anaeromyxobacter oryzae TaxID=2918170 RepID=A0ABN6MUQ7_9BACT|nr:hypothetical protein [Anaeromyxobacter oryzae]BDG04673.1 hypothetical protein AMOR_36690 [Anaeromyxobacter oryzae]
MSRPLAPVLAAAVLALPLGARGAEPLDMDLSRLGAPDARVWKAMDGTLSDADAALRANDAKVRFGILSSEMALAISSAILHPASTTGHSGFDFDLEAAYVGVHPSIIGSGATAASDWPTHALTPHELFLPAFHVRKALPFSFELGGRMIYLSQSSYFAAQVEGKWALNEGFDVLPDLAVRFAWTQLFGQRDWDLGVGDVDLMISKRWGVNAVTSFTPYAAARFSLVRASTSVIQYQPTTDVTQAMDTSAAFPRLSAGYYRTTVGLRMTAYAVSMAAEATYFGGSKYSGKADPTAAQYPSFRLNSSWGGAWKFGFEF